MNAAGTQRAAIPALPMITISNPTIRRMLEMVLGHAAGVSLNWNHLLQRVTEEGV